MFQNKKQYSLFFILLLVLGIVTVLSMIYGAVNISIDDIVNSMIHSFRNSDNMPLNERIFIDIRLPRSVLCVFVGASLAVGGTLMQALFRNSIIEPGLIGTSSGAAFGASLYFVLGSIFSFNANEWTLPFAACLGAFLSTFLVFILSQSNQNNKSSITKLLLTGIAINALFLSAVGFLSYIARDPQARSITFWNLGTLSGANWNSCIIVGAVSICCISVALTYSKQLNALMIGEEEASFLGVNIKQLKIKILLVNVVLIAVSTSFVGVISFVGLIVPHLLRMINGSDNRFLIINSAVLGALLLSIADLLSRLIISPAELPIGIITSVVGVPVFIVLLGKKNYFF